MACDLFTKRREILQPFFVFIAYKKMYSKLSKQSFASFPSMVVILVANASNIATLVPSQSESTGFSGANESPKVSESFLQMPHIMFVSIWCHLPSNSLVLSYINCCFCRLCMRSGTQNYILFSTQKLTHSISPRV